MESQTAKVIPLSAKAAPQEVEVERGSEVRGMELAPIDEIVIVVSDEQLEALATLYLMNPARKAMTFEAYLAVKGYAREVASARVSTA